MKLETTTNDCMPPEYCLPNSKEVPLSCLVPPVDSNPGAYQCLKILSPSGWNPPPGNRKLAGMSVLS